MIDFVRNSFRTVFTIFLWLLLISSIIGGGFLGNIYGHIFGFEKGLSIFLGGIIGLIIGLIIVIIGGGQMAIFLKIDENIEYIKISLFGNNSSYIDNSISNFNSSITGVNNILGNISDDIFMINLLLNNPIISIMKIIKKIWDNEKFPLYECIERDVQIGFYINEEKAWIGQNLEEDCLKEYLIFKIIDDELIEKAEKHFKNKIIKDDFNNYSIFAKIKINTITLCETEKEKLEILNKWFNEEIYILFEEKNKSSRKTKKVPDTAEVIYE